MTGRLPSSTETRTHNSRTDAVGTALGGASVVIQSGQDIHLQGSSAVADDGITISAARDVNITAAQTRSGHSRFEETKDSGVFSDGGMGVTIGKRVQSSEQQTQGTGATASTVGAIGGDVNITAGQTYRQTGSDVLAPGGDITVQAESIAITEARTTERTTTEEKFKQSGISVGLSNPVIDALQGVVNTAEALANTGDARTQALGLAVAALQGKQLYDAARAIASNPAAAAGVGINISLGSSKSQSKSEVVRDGAQGSNVVASGNVTLNAEGAGLASNVRVQGSTIESGNTARLHAEGDIELIAAIQSTRETNSQSSKSGSIGMGFNAGGAQSGISFNAGASSGKGQGLGDELTHANTLIQAGQRVVVESGDDTTLRGAVVTAPSVQANIGGELLIESLQDRATYSEHSKSASAGVSVCIPPLCYGASSISGGVGQTDIDSSYASVRDQSAIRAGSSGFDVITQGKTTLVGGAITSTQAAVDSGANRFDSQGGLELSDIQNQASYEADGYSVNASFSTQLGDQSNAKTTEQKKAAAVPTSPGGSAGIGSDQGSASSVTSAAISGIAGDTQARTGDAGTGIAPIFERERVKDEVNAQIAITAEFGKLASKAVGDYARSQLKQAGDLRDQASGESDMDRKSALIAEAEELESNWGDRGTLRVLAHTTIGALTGGTTGAAGAATGTLTAPLVAEALDAAGVESELANVLTAIASTAAGTSVGGSAGTAAAFNEVVNNYLNHKRPSLLRFSEKEKFEAALLACQSGEATSCKTRDELAALSRQRDVELAVACAGSTPHLCQDKVSEAQAMGNTVQRTESGFTYANSPSLISLNTATIGSPKPNPALTDNFHYLVAKGTSAGLVLALPGPEDLLAGAVLLTAPGKFLAEVVVEGGQKLLRFADGTTARMGSREAREIALAKIDNNFYTEGAPVQYGSSVFVTNPNEAVFWSGRTDGVGGQVTAKNIAELHKGKTLETLMENRLISMPNFDPTDPSSVNFWKEVSIELAKHASGEVRAVVGSVVRPKNIWETYELPTLLKNEAVTRITIIDPKTKRETIIFERTRK